ncbi:MAG: hypothetical protein KME28_01040 [Pelatocladus maniniholoensis HA4357-MV3]|jgi:hypothetical protein|uniref:Uncharacterized protein n=1 Tax=Pelatocladus maniniholoensis HA4357-MV3 TaxID=1117104 RepID=A0A9E3LQX0_9NOST|nr:hypothetical protein [Pelatocladus maniniholoensis HA4357-MV3]BAZ69472.1 hypothetical protein NIES4106_42440 [Fischerella sp. NIES-4106]
MKPDEIEAVLQTAFNRCETANCPLTDMQKQILLQVVEQIQGNCDLELSDQPNPLDELTPQELQSFLRYIKAQEKQDFSWKAQLLNDWLRENNSGEVQFIRDRYGLQWLNRIQPYHFNQYSSEDILNLKVGDRIEVCNALWEWVQDNGPCPREWFPCLVIQVDEIQNGNGSCINCIVRFNNGAEYEIQGIYEWNRYNWRWVMSGDR